MNITPKIGSGLPPKECTREEKFKQLNAIVNKKFESKIIHSPKVKEIMSVTENNKSTIEQPITIYLHYYNNCIMHVNNKY